jgi:aromatic ring hydroxylase
VLAGKIGIHTNPAYAEDVNYQGKQASFIVPVAAMGVTTICRKLSSRHPNPFVSPLSCRFDELDGQMWLDNVLIPWERVFCTIRCRSRSRAGCSGTSSIAG